MGSAHACEARKTSTALGQGTQGRVVGTEPGRHSIDLGCYYASPTNAFYRHLAQGGFTPRQLEPMDFRQSLDYGIGLDDVYDDADALRARLDVVSPLAVCFNSMEALRRYAGVDRIRLPWRGEAARRYSELGEVARALSDSSWEASQYWPLRVEDLRELRSRLRLAAALVGAAVDQKGSRCETGAVTLRWSSEPHRRDPFSQFQVVVGSWSDSIRIDHWSFRYE